MDSSSKEHNFKDKISELVLGFLELLSKLIIFKDTHDATSSIKYASIFTDF